MQIDRSIQGTTFLFYRKRLITALHSVEKLASFCAQSSLNHHVWSVSFPFYPAWLKCLRGFFCLFVCLFLQRIWSIKMALLILLVSQNNKWVSYSFLLRIQMYLPFLRVISKGWFGDTVLFCDYILNQMFDASFLLSRWWWFFFF